VVSAGEQGVIKKACGLALALKWVAVAADFDYRFGGSILVANGRVRTMSAEVRILAPCDTRERSGSRPDLAEVPDHCRPWRWSGFAYRLTTMLV
jgi:hypothetical protein